MKEKEILKVNAKHYEGLEIREDANCILKITNYNLKYCDIRGQVFKEIALKDIVNAGVISDSKKIKVLLAEVLLVVYCLVMLV